MSSWSDRILKKFENEALKSQIETAIYENLEILIYPHVFSPLAFPSTQICIQNLPDIVGNRSFLEIGSGTGVNVLAILLGSTNKKPDFLATDINPSAVLNINANLAKYSFPQIAILSDVFESIAPERKFQDIIWNHPFNNVEVTSEIAPKIYLKSGFDNGYEALKRFFMDGKNYLTSGGRLLLCTSREVGDWNLIKTLAKNNGFAREPKILVETKNQEMDLCIAEFAL